MKKSLILLFLELLLGLYFMNILFAVVTIPEIVLKLDPWLFFLAGALLIFESLKYLRTTRRVKVN